jgi:hypothetical protein
LSTNDRPHTRFSMRDPINEVAVASRATMAHLVHILGIVGSFLRNRKREMRENLLCMKRWYRWARSGKGPCEVEEGRREELQVSHPPVSSCQVSDNCSRGVGIQGMSGCQNMICWSSLRRRLRDGNPRMPCCDASEHGNILPIL